jgi:hypothetical protein
MLKQPHYNNMSRYAGMYRGVQKLVGSFVSDSQVPYPIVTLAHIIKAMKEMEESDDPKFHEYDKVLSEIGKVESIKEWEARK